MVTFWVQLSWVVEKDAWSINKRIRARDVGTNVTRVVMQPTLEQTRQERSFLILKILMLMYLILKILVLMVLPPLPACAR